MISGLKHPRTETSQPSGVFFFFYIFQGVRQSVLTLTSTALGGGLLILPFCFRLVGVVLGTLILLIHGFAAAISIEFLMDKAVESGVSDLSHVRNRENYIVSV